MVLISSFTVYAEPGDVGEEVKLDYQILAWSTFKFYISESDNEAGELIVDGNLHHTRYAGSTNLKPGKTYYLHVRATGASHEQTFAGKFTLNGNDLNFSNNSNELLTNPNDFRACSGGFGIGSVGAVFDPRTWPDSLPGVRFICATTQHNAIYFSTTITPATPELTAYATGVSNGVNLTWNSISSAVNYSVERSTTMGGPYTIVASDLTSTGYADKDVRPNTTYYYVVKSKISDTEIITSAEVSAVPVFQAVDSKLKIVLEPGEKLQLSVDDHLDENTNMVWTSSNGTVAEVDENGVVSSVNTGDAVIYIRSKEGTYTDEINILVVDNAEDYRLAVDLNVGNVRRLTVDDLTNTLNVTWNSSDATVATVSSKGVVTAKGKGLTLAKATDKDGNVVGQVYVRVRE